MTDNNVSTEITIRIGGAREAQSQLAGVAAPFAKIKSGAKEATQANKELTSSTLHRHGLVPSDTG